MGIFSGVSNFLFGNNDVKKNQAKIDKALESLTYNPEDYFTNYEYYKDPLLYETYLQESNAYDNVKVDPTVLAAQNDALNKLINLSEAKGLNAIDQQALQEIISNENRNLQGQNEAILQNAMERGVYGSGLELAQRLQAAQSSANRMNNQDMNVMAQAQQRALEALSNYGNLANTMRNQDYSEQSKKAEAQNAINQFNVQQMTNSNTGNIDNRNKVNQANTDIYNRQQDSNVQAARDKFGNDITKANIQVGSWNNNVTNAINKENSDKALTGNLIVAGAGLFGSGKK